VSRLLGIKCKTIHVNQEQYADDCCGCFFYSNKGRTTARETGVSSQADVHVQSHSKILHNGRAIRGGDRGGRGVAVVEATYFENQTGGGGEGCEHIYLSSFRWEDDGGMSCLHYLALGRRHTEYVGMRYPGGLNYPILGSANGVRGDDSVAGRSELLVLLLQQGRITPYSLLAVNNHGANPLHAAACGGDVAIIAAMVRKPSQKYSKPTFAVGAVDTALESRDTTPYSPAAGVRGARAVDVAGKYGHAHSARLLGLGLLSHIDLAEISKVGSIDNSHGKLNTPLTFRISPDSWESLRAYPAEQRVC
jgi:hypothetical protein